jgi:excisionase family DNA binding protein
VESEAKMNGMSEEKLLKKKQVAEVLSCSLRTVDRLVNVGRLTRVKILGAIRFRWSQVQMLMNGGNHDIQS